MSVTQVLKYSSYHNTKLSSVGALISVVQNGRRGKGCTIVDCNNGFS